MSERSLRQFFAPGGALASALDGYEQRPEQLDLALAIEAAIVSGDKLVAEAGTGVGKTLAYLVPALASGLKVLVSTGTKNLQEQIVDKDLPLVERATGKKFDLVVLKGRSNYLCEARFEKLTAQRRLPGVLGDDAAQRLIAWRNTTESGDRAELASIPDGAAVWGELSVTGEQCTGRRCQQFERCWVTRIRQRAAQCQLLVVNHHLYFADAALRARTGDADVTILPPHDVVIFDEAHQIDETASENFGVDLSEARLADFIRDGQRLSSGDLALGASLLPQLDTLGQYGQQLFDALPFSAGRASLTEAVCRGRVEALRVEIERTLSVIEAMLDGSKLEEARPLKRRAAQLAAELAFTMFAGQPAALTSELDQRPADEQEAPVVRFTEGGRNRTLAARPLDAAPLIRRAIGERPAIFVSATLALNGDFSHFAARVGLERPTTLLVASPFDYGNQARLYVASDLPDPNSPEFAEQAALRATELVDAAGGGAFVLCTSMKVLDQMARTLRQSSHAVLVQGDAPRGHLLERFRQHGSAVLVATMSFWSGVDVPGSALRLVVIDRLPFAAMGDPIVAARLEWLKSRGEQPFGAYQLPHAALILRQGFGRLIRRQTDRGLVALLDRRVVTESYGKKFLDALPTCPRLSDAEAARRYARSLVPNAHP